MRDTEYEFLTEDQIRVLSKQSLAIEIVGSRMEYKRTGDDRYWAQWIRLEREWKQRYL